MTAKRFKLFMATPLAWYFSLAAAFAHGDKPHSTRELWGAWTFEPGVVIGLGLAAGLYATGVANLWRSTRLGRGIRLWEAACYAAGWAALVLALVSPLHPWGRVLFSAHMAQHEILMLVAAPLLVLGRPLIPMLKALPKPCVRSLVTFAKGSTWRSIWVILSNPLAAWLLHAVVLWLWHIPSLFEATIDNDAVHALQHFSFLGTALLFWWSVLEGRTRALGYGMAVLYLFTTGLHNGLLGALLTFAQTVWYPSYAETASWWGLTALEDQQVGGLIMWVPAGLVYVIAGLALFAGWLRESDRHFTVPDEIPPLLESERFT